MIRYFSPARVWRITAAVACGLALAALGLGWLLPRPAIATGDGPPASLVIIRYHGPADLARLAPLKLHLLNGGPTSNDGLWGAGR
ncbi:MAG: hypothetical protein ACE5G8_08040 [Anaerolineae bacterium]